MNRIIFLILFLIVSITLFSQSTGERAKAYYTEASNAYKNGKYSSAIEYLDKTEEILGKTNARILSLKVKAYYNDEDYQKAKENLDLFSNYSSKATQELKDETYAYIVKVEEEMKAEEARKERERLAEIEKKKQEDSEKAIHHISATFRPKEYGYELKVPFRYTFIDCLGTIALAITLDKRNATTQAYIFNGQRYAIYDLGKEAFADFRKSILYADMKIEILLKDATLKSHMELKTVMSGIASCFGQSYSLEDSDRYTELINELDQLTINILDIDIKGRDYRLEDIIKRK